MDEDEYLDIETGCIYGITTHAFHAFWKDSNRYVREGVIWLILNGVKTNVSVQTGQPI